MSGKAVDQVGKKFGYWSVIERAGANNKGAATWLCECTCGTRKVVSAENLTRGKSKSCGCMKYTLQSNALRKHGHTRFDGYTTGTYRSWHAARQRCENPNHKQYDDYGGRGIRFCERWRDFRNFLSDMGERPEGRTLDRIKVNGDYEPGNCRWATRKEQSLNKRKRTSHSAVSPIIEAARIVASAANDNVPGISGLRTALAAYDSEAA